MTSRAAALVTTVAVVMLLLAGCLGPPGAPGFPDADDSDPTVTRVETLHGVIEVPAEPQRIVAVSYDTPWQLMSLGVDVIGAQDYTRDLPSMSEEHKDYLADTEPIGTYGEPNLEAIAALKPDLIVGDNKEIDNPMYDKLRAIAPTVVASGADRGDWKSIVGILAEATGSGAVLTEVRNEFNAKVDDIRFTYARQLETLTFAAITFGSDEATFSVLYPSGVIGSLYQELEVRLAPGIPDDDPVAGFAEFSTERIPDILGGADVIITPAQADGSRDDALEPLFAHPLFAKLPASVADRVFEVPVGVTDYASAMDYLDRVARDVLAEL